MMKLGEMVRSFFSRLAGPRKPTPGAIARMRLEESRRERSRSHWEIRPPSSECELPFGTELGIVQDETPSHTRKQSSDRIKISVNRIR
jgi:hypothetical protein